MTKRQIMANNRIELGLKVGIFQGPWNWAAECIDSI